MSYLVLARKFRPQTFESVVGQEHISRGLANAIITGRAPHALLLTGPRGVGKTTTARIFAKALNCQNRPEQAELEKLPFEEALKKVEPCNECVNCQEISKSSSLSVWEVDGASNNSVENVRDLIESLRALPPPGSRFKIYIVDEVHMLSVAAFNALLKSLEEPPPNTVFIFATTEPHRVPDTVISRCQRHDFHRIPTSAIESKLSEIASEEGVRVDAAALRLIARKAAGGMRDAESMLDRVIGFSSEAADLNSVERILGFLDRQIFTDLIRAVCSHEPARCFEIIGRIFDQSVDLRAFLADFVLSWRNVLAIRIASDSKRPWEDSELAEQLGLAGEELTQLKAATPELSVFDAQRLFDIAAKTADHCVTPAFPRYLLEAGVAKMSTLESLRPIAEIAALFDGDRAAQKPALRTATPAKSVVNAESPAVEPTLPVERGPLVWADFVSTVRAATEKVLAEYLQRVTPRSFRPGVFSVEGTDFYLSALQEPQMHQTLKKLLARYSGVQAWAFDFQPIVATAKQAGGAAAPGSLRAEEQRAELERDRAVTVEAQNSDAVKNALSAFSGSRVDRVSVIKE